MALPVFDLDAIAKQLQTQWAGDLEGSYRRWTGDTVYIFIASSTVVDGVNSEEDGWTAMSSDQRAKVIEAFSIWQELIGLNLVQLADPSGAQITFGYSTNTKNGGTYTSPDTSFLPIGGTPTNPIYAIDSEKIWMANNATVWPELQPGAVAYNTRGFETYLHEIGHSLGLSHPGSYNAGDANLTYANDAEFTTDNTQYTIMSYFGDYQVGTGWLQDGSSTSDLFPSTPMV